MESVLRFYPAAFLIVAAGVLLQRPLDRTAWLLALLFISLIAAAPIEEDLLHPALRRFALCFKLLGGLVPVALYWFFAIFPAQSPIERRAPWLKHVLLVPTVVVLATLMVDGRPRAEFCAPAAHRRVARLASPWSRCSSCTGVSRLPSVSSRSS